MPCLALEPAPDAFHPLVALTTDASMESNLSQVIARQDWRGVMGITGIMGIMDIIHPSVCLESASISADAQRMNPSVKHCFRSGRSDRPLTKLPPWLSSLGCCLNYITFLHDVSSGCTVMDDV